MGTEFICKMCSFSDFYNDFEAPHECPECSHRFYTLRILKEPCKKEPRKKVKFVNIGYKDTPRYSVSLGVPETQIEEAKKLHPQAEWKKFGHSYRPLIKNRAEKKKMMKQAHYEEYDPKDFKGKEG